MSSLEIIPVSNLPLYRKGDDLVGTLLKQLDQSKQKLQDGDVLVIAQKVVSKIEGRQIRLRDVEPSLDAIALANETEKDPRVVELILRESTNVVRKKLGVLIVRHKLGHVGAHAGIDQSNIDHDHDDSALLLPIDPDASAMRIFRQIQQETHINVGVIIADSANRPWRLGTVAVAIGAANTDVLIDQRGENDLYGRELKVTLINRADAIAAAANLVMGESTESIPVAIVRGIGNSNSDHTARLTNRPLEEDLFQ